MIIKEDTNIRSPLRFPGSKSKVLRKLHPFLKYPHIEYREPFVGGGAIFFGKEKSTINWLNDKDSNVSNFLKIVKNNPDELCDLVNRIRPTIDLWHKFRSEINSELEPLEKAFRFLFFNRTNYSGIYNAYPIGGLNQTSQYKIDCRWNPKLLCTRIINCSKKLSNVRITNQDFREIITENGDNVLLMIDPPYFKKGSSLYPVFMSADEHFELANLLSRSRHPFLLTIDDCPEVKEMYSWANIIQKHWYYTVNSKKQDNVGKELFVTNISIQTSWSDL